jgi:transposase
VTEWLLPGLACPCCGAVTFADPPGAHAGAVSYGPVLNAAAVLLSCHGNVPPERAGFDDAMLAALASEDVLAADETPVNVLGGIATPAPALGRR